MRVPAFKNTTKHEKTPRERERTQMGAREGKRATFWAVPRRAVVRRGRSWGGGAPAEGVRGWEQGPSQIGLKQSWPKQVTNLSKRFGRSRSRPPCPPRFWAHHFCPLHPRGPHPSPFGAPPSGAPSGPHPLPPPSFGPPTLRGPNWIGGHSHWMKPFLDETVFGRNRLWMKVSSQKFLKTKRSLGEIVTG